MAVVEVLGGGTISPGSDGVPGRLTVGSYTQNSLATLMIQIATDQSSVLKVSGNANLAGFLEPVLLNGFVPEVDDTFIFLLYQTHNGEFETIKNVNFDGMHWEISYKGSIAFLTAVQGPLPGVPDQGSTFLLLTLGLLGLVTYQRQLLRTQY